ncbi:alpha/beta hydrolase fold domain-containing protein [Gordonia pseudamarae]|jgi:acetyl esterase|uniref:Alpha/beta hydrolase fold domain-containing protein n=1 Tax=Gordonia pseudamarae TaxID=2831662 RepID=A0ABX6IMD1_9ACTN|nr:MULTISPECIES: alpha/beta hydrolase [Gordonia]MBD0022208.1 alpha/beta hydrolase [Gordonia sp. (in: high G+C Gram-positive bacteria)]QHN28223.1 alpha/beta hydrolase fold domain-containing protein [Gordonia pseudamarae]QHN37083.1 alpha/beta hydrolase fold domain-containing protein [Gordonia pseudamarae]
MTDITHVESDVPLDVWDPDVAPMVERMRQSGATSFRTVGVQGVRNNLESIVRPTGPAMASVHDADCEGPGGPIPLRIYRPPTAPGSGAPALVWFHGGGMIMGSLDSFDRLARDVAAATGAVVVNVDYRLAPEHRYPAGHDDAYAALCWVNRHADQIGVDRARIGVGGDSAGGGLAAATALRSRDEHGPNICQQIMFYPGLERPVDRPSMRRFGNSAFLTVDDITWMKNLYLGDDPALDDEYGSPALATDLAGLPPAIVVTGFADPLRDGVEEYGRRLQDAGVPTAILRYPGVGHGFAMQTSTVARARTAMAEVGALAAARFSAGQADSTVSG